MATVAKSDRITTVTLASAIAGPFDLTFRMFDDDGLSVFVNGQPRDDFTITSNYVDGFDDNATIMFDSVLEIGDVVDVYGDLNPGRANDYQNGPGLTEAFNIEFGRLWSAMSEVKRDTKRSFRFFDTVSPIALQPGRYIVTNDSGTGITFGPTVTEILEATEISQTSAAEAVKAEQGAALSKDQAQVAALAAGAPIVISLSSPVPYEDTIEILQTGAGSQVWQVISGVWEIVGWLSKPVFNDIADMAAAKGLIDGQDATVRNAFNGGSEDFDWVAGGTLTADGALVVDGVGGQWVSKRYEGGPVGTAVKSQQGAYPAWGLLAMNGISDDTSPLVSLDAAAVGAGKGIKIANGTALVGSDITISSDLRFVRGGMLKPASGVTITMAGEVTAGARQIFDLSAGGSIKFTRTQDVKPEWVGNGASNVRTIMKASAPGSRTVLRGVEYLIDYLHFDNSPDTEDGVDDGKVIAGVTAANRFTSPQTGGGGAGSALVVPPADRSYKGTVLRFKSGETIPTDFVLADSTYTIVARSYSAIRLENLMLHGNAGAVNGLAVGAIKDLQLHNIYICGFTGDGMYSNAGSGGGNNQVKITGFLEIFFNDGDGLKGAWGDMRAFSDVVSHHNLGKGASITAGYIHFSSLYCYTNALEGVEWTNQSMSQIGLLRCEDNGYEGLNYASTAKGLAIETAMVPDNGNATGASTGRRTGIRNLGTDLRINELVNPFRDNPETLASSGLAEQQLYTLYDGPAVTGGYIGRMRDEAFGQSGKPATGRGLLIDAAVRNGKGTKIKERRTINSTFANATANTYALFKQVDIYSLIKIDDVSFGFTVPNSDANASAHGMGMSFELTATASATVSWGTDYLDSSGAALSGIALTSGQVLSISFARVRGKWINLTKVVV